MPLTAPHPQTVTSGHDDGRPQDGRPVDAPRRMPGAPSPDVPRLSPPNLTMTGLLGVTAPAEVVKPAATPASTTFQVSLFGLVYHRGAFLLVQPRQPILPGGSLSLPGLTLREGSGEAVAETELRRVLLRQVGIGVGDLHLVGSYVGRGSEDGRADSRLYLVFSAEYCSGILNPNLADVRTAEWVAAGELRERGVPEWLLSAAQVVTASAAGTEARGAAPRLGLFRRR